LPPASVGGQRLPRFLFQEPASVGFSTTGFSQRLKACVEKQARSLLKDGPVGLEYHRLKPVATGRRCRLKPGTEMRLKTQSG